MKDAQYNGMVKEFLITIEDAEHQLQKQNFKCALSGKELKISRFRQEDKTASLDRIDSNKGYIKGNIQWIHKDLNYMKNDLSQDDFIHWCREIVNYQENIKNEILC